MGNQHQQGNLPRRVLERVAVLASGGLDSAVLLAGLSRHSRVAPVYVQFGLSWEAAEKATLAAFLSSLDCPELEPLTLLEMPMRSLYGPHWSITGDSIPDYDAPLDADYLPGRNVLLVGLAAVWCSLQGISQIALGSLISNPYADATPQFFQDYGRLLSGALSHNLDVLTPYRGRHKEDLIRDHAGLPLHLTLTCVDPQMSPQVTAAEIIKDGGPLHCGACIKCRERQDAFVKAGVPDPTRYAT